MMPGVVAGFPQAAGVRYTVTVGHRADTSQYGFNLPLWFAGVDYGGIEPTPELGDGIILRSSYWYYGELGEQVTLTFQRPDFSSNTFTPVTLSEVLSLIKNIAINGTAFVLAEAGNTFQSQTTASFNFPTTNNPFGNVAGAKIPVVMHYV